MKDKKADGQSWLLWEVFGVVAVIAVSWLSLNTEQTSHGSGSAIKAIEKPSDPLTTQCLGDLQSQQKLAHLAVQAMRAYGRIDPGLFDTTPPRDGQPLIRVSKDASPLPSAEEQLCPTDGRP